MPAGDGLPKVAAWFDEVAKSADRAAAALDREIEKTNELADARGKAARAASAAQAKRMRDMYGPDWRSASEMAGDQADAWNANPNRTTTMVPGSQGLNFLSPDVLDMEGYTKGSYRGANAATRAYDQQTASDFEELAKRITSAWGKGNYMATIFSTIAGFIREGRFSGVVGRQYAQAIITNFAAGFSREAADPTSSPEMRTLDAELLMFISSGRIP